METITVIQGTPEWHEHRAKYFNASDAPAMMGVSSYKTRQQFIEERATGITKEVDAATEARFAEGHRFEALALPLAEEIIGEALYPVVGVKGKYSASFDGITMLEDILLEHKRLNDRIRKATSAEELPEEYKVQMDHQLMVSEAKKCLFMASLWEGDVCVEKVYFFYETTQERIDNLKAAWEQFEKDKQEFLSAYKPKEKAATQVLVTFETLPALHIEISGGVTASNLSSFESHAKEAIDAINTSLVTDDDFFVADKATKWCKEVEESIAAAKTHSLGQTQSIAEVFRTLDTLSEMVRQKRLLLEKQIEIEKKSRKTDRVIDAKKEFSAHIEALQSNFKTIDLAQIIPEPDFGGAIKGLKTLSSVDEKLGVALANGKILANKIAKEVEEKILWLEDVTKENSLLIHDLQLLISKPIDDFKAVINNRINEEKQRQEAKLKSERERIRAEEEAKLKSEQESIAAEIEEKKHEEAKLVSTPAEVVINCQDEIAAFMKRRDFGKEAQKVRAILVEFVKFQSTYVAG